MGNHFVVRLGGCNGRVKMGVRRWRGMQMHVPGVVGIKLNARRQVSGTTNSLWIGRVNVNAKAKTMKMATKRVEGYVPSNLVSGS